MKSSGVILVLAVLSHVVSQGQGHSTGAPTDACANMTPGHGFTPQSSTPPYSVSASTSSYTAGQSVTVTVTGGSTQFKGFLLQARTADGSIVGSFTTTSGVTQGVQCAASATSSLTHVNPSLKTSITTTWSTPTSVGDVTFKVTVVQQFTTYWVGIPASTVLRDVTPPPSTTPGTHTTLTLTSTLPKTSAPSLSLAPSTNTTTPLVSSSLSSNSSVLILTSPPTNITSPPLVSSSLSSNSSVLILTSLPTTQLLSTAAPEDNDNDSYTSSTPELPAVATATSPSPSSTTAAAPSTTPATSVGGIDLTSCQVTKGCLQYPCPQGAGSGICAVVTWQVDMTSSRRKRDESSSTNVSPVVNFEMYGLTDGWAAVGFSHDQRMGDDSVVDCVNDGTGKVVVQSSYNSPAPTNTPLSNPNLGLSNTRTEFTNGAITCRFSRQVYNTGDPHFFNVSQPFYLLLGFGPASQGVVGYHFNYFPIISQAQINVVTSLQGGTGGAAAVSDYIKAHACLMVVAWVMLASIGVLMARTMRTTLRGKKLLDSPLWLGIHRILLVTAVACTAASFIVIFVYNAGIYSFPLNSLTVGQAHGALGIITMILAIINPIVILTRPKPGKTGYKCIGMLHKVIGWLLHPIAAVTMVLGSLVLYSDGTSVDPTHNPVFWLLIAAIVVHLLAELFFAVDERCTSRKTTSPQGEVELAKEGEETKVRVSSSSKSTAHRITMFVAYVLIMIGLTVAILVLIGLL